MRRSAAPSRRNEGKPPVICENFAQTNSLFNACSTNNMSVDVTESSNALKFQTLGKPGSGHEQARSPIVRPVLKDFTTNALSTNNTEATMVPTTDSSRYFSCVWCKKSGRKHKKWEGDGFIKVGERTVILIDESGKELSRGSGYKVAALQDLEDGSQISVGSKEVEIGATVDGLLWNAKTKESKESKKSENKSTSSLKSIKRKKSSEEDTLPESQPDNTAVPKSFLSKERFKPFKIPRRTQEGEQYTPARNVSPGVPMFDPNKEGALVFPRPPVGHHLRTERLVDVVLDPYISSKIRPHQRTGILFLYSNLLGFKTVSTDSGLHTIKGGILADDMGLGKTLQTVALIWTLLKQSPVAGASLAKKILIVAPTSLLNNWADEFRKWLGTERIIVHIADSASKVSIFKSYTNAPVLIVSYEMMVRSESELQNIKWDLIVCDEAHRLKNSEIKTSSCLSRLKCERKVLLTGTPVQNDLHEYFCLVSVVAPNVLGCKSKFNAEYVSVIEKGREPSASSDQINEANTALSKLSQISGRILLRRTSDIISKYLPPKTINIVFCRPSEFQSNVYSREVSTLLDRITFEPGNHLTAVSTLKKICNSPHLLGDLETSGIPSPSTWEEQSGKLSVLTCFLLTLIQTTDEKVVLVSLSTSTLDLLSALCDRYGIPTVRLDGKTPPSSRMQIVNRFNATTSVARVFLLSSKAGGSGLNLTGASRIVLYDLDWNPATDMQAMARIWRSGQKNHCRIYRFITAGTIEEKIFQRQVMKSGLAGGLESQELGGESVAQFTAEELKDIFTFRPDIECETHDLLECDCGGSGELRVQSQPELNVRKCQLGEKKSVERSLSNMEQLKSWRHYSFPIEGQEDECLKSAESFISFLFTHFEDSSEA